MTRWIAQTATRLGGLGLVATAFCMLMSPGKVGAQSLPLLGGPSAISIGAYFPSDSDASHRGGPTQLYADLRYAFPVSVPLTPTRTLVDVGVETGAKDGNHSTIIPITIGEYVGGKGGPTAGGNAFAGIGVGAYILNQSGFSSAARFGGYVAAGYNFTQNIFVEAKYQAVDHGNGPLVSLGLRF